MIWDLIGRHTVLETYKKLRELNPPLDAELTILEEDRLYKLSEDAEELYWLAVDYIEYRRRNSGLLCKEEERALYELIKAYAKAFTIKYAPGYCRGYIRRSAGLETYTKWTMNDIEYLIMYNGSPRTKDPEVFISFERADGYGILIRYDEREKRYKVSFHS